MFDWFTFTAQIANFLILVWLLRRFLYAPLTKAMDDREAEIQTRLDSAAAAKELADKSRLLLSGQVEEIERTRLSKLEAMEKEVADTRKQLMLNVRSEVEKLEQISRESLEREKTRMMSQFKKQMHNDILEITRRIMRDLADRELETQIVRKFLNEASAEDSISVSSAKPSVLVRTSFNMEPQSKEEIRESLAAMLKRSPELIFERSSKAIAGIEVIIDGRKASWTVDDYLSTLDRRISGATTNDIS
jgi:F-type H+-transporting ATPase subunit b